MEASIVDLRYHMKEVLAALERREQVTITYHGKRRGLLLPLPEQTGSGRVADHPFFGMAGREQPPVAEIMDDLRAGRHDAV